VADALLYLVWIGAAALLYVILIAALHARRGRLSSPSADLTAVTDEPDDAS
jgi:hypothetical protein